MSSRKVSVIGLGYVGLPIAVAFGARSEVIAFDIDGSRVDELRNGVDRNGEVSSSELSRVRLWLTQDAAELKNADFHIVTVPTPVDEAMQPDLTPVIEATRTVGKILKVGDIVVYESTVYPGATEEVCVPLLEEVSGLVNGRDFKVGYSPERINPGDRSHQFSRILKVVSGQDPETSRVVAEVYQSVVDAGVHVAPTIKVAEAAKVIENVQRDLNIALMNEIALLFERLGIDTGDVLAAAGTKWNFLPFRPGLVGGHCIGVDPYYLTYKAAQVGYAPQVILAGRRINDQMGQYVAREVMKALAQKKAALQGCVVTILGLSFKENVRDIRNSKVVDIYRELKEWGVAVQVYDPVVEPGQARHEYGIELIDRVALQPADAVVFAVAHQQFVQAGWPFVSDLLKDQSGVVYDIRGVLRREEIPAKVLLRRL